MPRSPVALASPGPPWDLSSHLEPGTRPSPRAGECSLCARHWQRLEKRPQSPVGMIDNFPANRTKYIPICPSARGENRLSGGTGPAQGPPVSEGCGQAPDARAAAWRPFPASSQTHGVLPRRSPRPAALASTEPVSWVTPLSVVMGTALSSAHSVQRGGRVRRTEGRARMRGWGRRWLLGGAIACPSHGRHHAVGGAGGPRGHGLFLLPDRSGGQGAEPPR